MFGWFRRPKDKLVFVSQKWERELTIKVIIAYAKGAGDSQRNDAYMETFRFQEEVLGSQPGSAYDEGHLTNRFLELARQIEEDGFLLSGGVDKQTGVGLISIPGHRVISVRFMEGIIGEWKEKES